MNYIDWHYFEVWPKIITLWRNTILFAYYYFSIPLHLKTLFSPWHRQKVKMRVGFHLDDFFGVISFNIISRILGTIVRTATIFYGLLFMTAGFAIGLVPVILWPVIPLLTLPVFLARSPQKGKEAAYFLENAGGNIQKLLHLLFREKEGLFIARHLGIPMKNITSEFTPTDSSFSSTCVNMMNQARKNKTLTLPELFKLVSEIYPPLSAFLAQNNLKSDDVSQTALWYEKLYARQTTPLLFDLTRIRNVAGIGHNWAYGYTVELDKFARDLTKIIPAFPLLFGREKEIADMERILLKTEGNNIVVAGEPGVARHLLVETLAYRILSGDAPRQLANKRILLLNMHSLTSAKTTTLEIKGLAQTLLEEADNAGNIIVAIDDIDKFVSTGDGRIDLSDVIAKFAESTIGVIGITNPASYHRFIKTNSGLSPLFEKVDVEAFGKDTMLDVLEVSIAPILEKKYHVAISYPAIVKTIEDADRYITATPFPAKAIELLDETCVYLTTIKKLSFLAAETVDEFLSEKMHMPLGDIQKAEAEKLSHLETLLHTRIINQKEAIAAISSSLRRSRLDVANPDKPVGTFLFLGPTGVGKTETAKALASVYFGHDDKLIRFDMSQYQGTKGIERLIGNADTGIPGELTSKLTDQPFSVLLLDEFEKADQTVYNLFLTLLDEGYIQDSLGRKVSAKNNIIIATSNAGAEFIRERLQQGLQENLLQKELIEYVQREKIFSPELLNRFDEVVVFTPLTEGQLREVARLMLNDLNERLKPKEISLYINQDLIRKVAALGFDPQFGARSMRRTITEKIENQLAQKLLAGSVKKGEQINIQL